MTDEEVETKFRTLAGRVLSDARVTSALKRLWKIDEERSAGIAFDVLDKR
jgi:hypothetical protein